MSSVSEKTMAGAFEVLRVADPGDAEALAAEVALMFRRLDHMSSHVYVSIDGTAVVHCGEWTTDSPQPPTTNPGDELLRTLSKESGAEVTQNFVGRLLVSIDGASAPEPAGIAVLATRHVKDVDAANALGELLVQSGEWKQHVPGFIGAAAYLSGDGREFLNYPRWVDAAAYEAYMADPRIAEGQSAISTVEEAKPEFIRCRS
ncbi:MAG TPA: antibiotic biosynthesis monooxygenase, partial [Pseudonocardiaceae bacterium]|nr:antibiotic biosynthesis monooxygenase [Pseudonocardiaceae bacterium]